MKKYVGAAAKNYKQTNGKRGLLIPALKKLVPETTKSNRSLLDIACGIGDLSEIAIQKGYTYYGLDISEDMIKRAQEIYPHNHYTIASATNFSSKYNNKFDVILISMLFTDLEKKIDIYKTLVQSKKLLKKDGVIIVGTVHPSFDRYMQAGILGRKGDKVAFKSYFSSGDTFHIQHAFDGKPYVFEDHHWTLTDYMDCIKKSGLCIVNLDECPPDNSVKGLDKTFFEERKKFPTYIVIVCKSA